MWTSLRSKVLKTPSLEHFPCPLSVIWPLASATLDCSEFAVTTSRGFPQLSPVLLHGIDGVYRWGIGFSVHFRIMAIIYSHVTDTGLFKWTCPLRKVGSWVITAGTSTGNQKTWFTGPRTWASYLIRIIQQYPQQPLASIEHWLCARHCVWHWHVLSSWTLTATLWNRYCSYSHFAEKNPNKVQRSEEASCSPAAREWQRQLFPLDLPILDFLITAVSLWGPLFPLP